MNEKIFSIEYFAGENRRFCGQINASDLRNLSYEFLEQDTGYYGITKLFHMVDNFKVRGWTKKNDFDGYFVQKDGKIYIEIESALNLTPHSDYDIIKDDTSNERRI